MTTSETTPAPDAAAARLEALRAALDASDPAPPARGGSLPGDGADADPDLVDRLRARRSAGHVAAAYSAAHGHPVGADDGAARTRWALSAPVTVAACVVLLLLALLVVGTSFWSGGGVEELGVTVDEPAGPALVEDAAPPVPSVPPDPPDTVVASSPEAGTGVVVHVIGQVAEPGLVDLPAGARVADALEAAGGATEDADLAALNLARTVVDGEQVHVPAPGEEPSAVGPQTGTSAESEAGGDALVPLNTADTDTLTSLPGVGPVTAERIVAWRDEHGPFTSVEELTEVNGIGPALLADVRDLVVL